MCDTVVLLHATAIILLLKYLAQRGIIILILQPHPAHLVMTTQTSMSQAPQEWQEVRPRTFSRPAKGQENSASFNQNIADGHTEVSREATSS